MRRNEAAILGRRMTFPELAFTIHGIKGASEQVRTVVLLPGARRSTRDASAVRVGAHLRRRVCRCDGAHDSSLYRRSGEQSRRVFELGAIASVVFGASQRLVAG